MNDDLEQRLEKIIRNSPHLMQVLTAAAELNLPEWYLGGGCIAHTVWNILSGKPPAEGIKDFDLVYFDSGDLSSESEQNSQERIRKLLPGVEVDLINEARVHLWFEEDFGMKIDPYLSTKDAIDHWPTTASAVGVNLKKDTLEIYAPFGLEDLFALTVRRNPATFAFEKYVPRIFERWVPRWPNLKVIAWE